MRRIEKVEAAIRAPVEPADTAACAQPSRTAPAVTTSDDSGLARTAASGSSLNAICSGAWRIVMPRGSFPPYSARISGVSPTRTISSWPGTTASQRARADLRGRAVAAHGIERDRDGAHPASRRLR